MTVNELRTLVDNLDEYIHIPGGIDRLKKMVLHLAVSGQLVPQDSSEGTGEELFQRIQAEKQELIKRDKLKKQKLLPRRWFPKRILLLRRRKPQLLREKR